ncbi:MAG TPA: hypothetical protein VHF25_06220, partial [Nitriliruptorales bacterium]|nr:hypothetical protein [Nitriliruptorales bacterium]
TGREVGGVLDRVADPSEWGSILVHAAGQAWYLTAATLGLAPLGLAALVVLTRRRRHDGPAAWRRRHDGPAAWPRRHDGPTAWPLDPPRTTAAIVVAGFLSVFAASTIFLSAGERIDILIYGRYNEAALPVVLAAGIAFLLTRGATVRSLGAVAVLLIVLADVTLLANDPAAFADPRKPTVNALGVLPFDLSPGGLDVLRITALTVIAAVALWLAVRLRPTVAVLLLGAWFLGAAIAVQRHVLIDYAAYWTRAVSLRDVIPATGADVVAYDTAHFSETLHGYQYWLGSVDLVRYDSAREHPPADLLLSSKQPAGLPTGSRLVATERAIDQALWALPGELQQRLEARGYLAPPGNAALPRTALRSHLDLHGPPPGSLQPGGSVRLTVRAFHDGAGSPWLPSRDPDSNDGAVGIGARWFPNDDPSTPVAVQRSYLTRTVLPGQAHEVVVELAARDDDEPLPPGRYRVAISLFEDGGVWFDEQRGGRLALTIDVV